LTDAKAQMVIRRPVREVFDAFVDPDVTTKIWFTHSTGRVEQGKHLRWDWEMYDVSAEVDVLTVVDLERIVIEWPYGPDETPTEVEWTFTPLGEAATFVAVTNRGFSGSPEDVANQAVDSTEGFALLLVGAKALLEHGIELNLVADHSPPETRS